MSAALYTYLTRLIYKNISWPLDSGLKWWFLYWPNFIIVDYMVAPFNLLTWNEGLRFMAAWKYWGHIALIIGLLALLTINGSDRKAHQ